MLLTSHFPPHMAVLKDPSSLISELLTSPGCYHCYLSSPKAYLLLERVSPRYSLTWHSFKAPPLSLIPHFTFASLQSCTLWG